MMRLSRDEESLLGVLYHDNYDVMLKAITGRATYRVAEWAWPKDCTKALEGLVKKELAESEKGDKAVGYFWYNISEKGRKLFEELDD